MPELTHDHLVVKAAAWLRARGCVVVATEWRAWVLDEQPDAIGWDCHGESTLVECKTSVSDFYADRQKPHRKGVLGMGLRRFYLVPKGLVGASVLPTGWGLLELRGSRVFVAKEADEPTWTRSLRATAELPLLVNAVRFPDRKLLVKRDGRWSHGDGHA